MLLLKAYIHHSKLQYQDRICLPGKTENGKLFSGILKANDLLSVAVPENTKIIIVASPEDDSVPFSIDQKLLDTMRKEKVDAELISVPPLTHDDAFLDAWPVAFYRIHKTWMDKQYCAQ
jgi:hypothetical protein